MGDKIPDFYGGICFHLSGEIVEEGGEKEVEYNNKKYRRNDRCSGSLADLFRAARTWNP